MKILVTGGMVVLGSAVSGRLVRERHRPVLMSRTLDRNLIGPIQGQIDIELGNVLDLPKLLSITGCNK